ncbi:hypothetical protein ACJRO7_014616 [Eucalyptus globulus]|uniref:Uncharacterized protein n=1 Tax=Eucalyptus globulus TaxID=34317 RepID=A0ABD3L0S9_EUCGL
MDFDARDRVRVRVRTQGHLTSRGLIKIAIFKKLLRLASRAASGIAGGRRGVGRRGDGPVEARRPGRAPGRRRVHPIPDAGGAMGM